jgi:hypothetical protein
MRKTKSELITYLVLRVLVVIVLLRELMEQRWNNVFLCGLTLVLVLIPSLVQRQLKLDLPGPLEILVLIFIFAAEILGEIGEFYVRVDNWDTMLHIVNGFLMAAIGFSMIDILNRHPRIHFNLSPAFVAFVAFCFSMTIGVFWEIFEYSIDRFLIKDMQKDTIVRTISSVALHPSGANIPIIVRDIQQTTITSVTHGVVSETVIRGGYLDIGIIDTMKDLMVNCLGAAVFSVIGAFYIQGRGKMARRFIPKLLTEQELEEEKEFRKARRERKTRLRQNKKSGDDTPPS